MSEEDQIEGDEGEDANENETNHETEGHSTVMDVVLPTRSSLRNIFRRARKVWGISMIKLVDFGTSFGTASEPEGTDEVNEATLEDGSEEPCDNDTAEGNDGEDGDGNIEEGEEGAEEIDEADEGEAEKEEEVVQGDEADSDGEQEIDLDEE